MSYFDAVVNVIWLYFWLFISCKEIEFFFSKYEGLQDGAQEGATGWRPEADFFYVDLVSYNLTKLTY